jgi:hypothetical protein
MRKKEKESLVLVLDKINNELREYDNGRFIVFSYTDIPKSGGNKVELGIRDKNNGKIRDSIKLEWKFRKCVMPDGTKEERIDMTIYNWIADFIVRTEEKEGKTNKNEPDG